jgi:hypothetical protein
LLVSLIFFPKLAFLGLAVSVGVLVPLNLAVVHSRRQGKAKATAETFLLTNLSGLCLIAVTALAMIAVVEKRVLPAIAAGVVLCFFLPMFRAVIQRLRPRPVLTEKQGQ